MAASVADVVGRLGRQDATLKNVNLTGKQHSDGELAELVDCLLARPNILMRLALGSNQLTDETGVKLACYVATSSTIDYLDLRANKFSEATYVAMAAALRTNTSLRALYLFSNLPVDQARVDAAFAGVLRINPSRSAGSDWMLYTPQQDYARLSSLAQSASAALSPTVLAFVEEQTQQLRRLEDALPVLLRGREEQGADVQAQLRDVQAALEATQQQLQACLQAKSAADSQLSAAQAQLAERTAQLSAAQGQLASSAARVQQLQQDNAALQAERDRLLAPSHPAAASSTSSSGLLDQWTYPLSSVRIDQEVPLTLGEGALGSVVRAQWQHTTVALKRLHFMDESAAAATAMGGSLSTEDRRAVLEVFMNECRTNAQLRHPNIVAFLGLVADADGAPRYLMMEHISGGTLHDLVHGGGELSAQRLHAILFDVCKALHYLHSLRPAVLHLDVKPKNVLLDGDKAKLADLGEAHVMRNTATRSTQQGTTSPFSVGTPNYKAPEIDMPSAVKTGKADMFSFGVMAAECAARELPAPAEGTPFVDGRRIFLLEEERRMADIAAVDAERWPHVRELVAHTIVDSPNDRWTARQALDCLLAAMK